MCSTRKTTKGGRLGPRTGIGLSGKILENIKCFFNCEYSKLEKYEITFFSNLENLQLKKIVFYSYHIPKIEIYEITYLSNLWKKSIKKIIFYFPKYYRFTLFPSRREGGGGNRRLR